MVVADQYTAAGGMTTIALLKRPCLWQFREHTGLWYFLLWIGV